MDHPQRNTESEAANSETSQERATFRCKKLNRSAEHIRAAQRIAAASSNPVETLDARTEGVYFRSASSSDSSHSADTRLETEPSRRKELPYMRRGLSSTRESNIRRRERQHHRRRRQRNAEECPQQQCSTHVLERRDTLRHGDAGYLSDREPDMEAVDAGLVCQFKLCGSEFAEVHLLERHVEHVHTCRICRRMTPELKHTVTPMCQRCVDEGTSPTWARLRGHGS